MGRPRTPSQRLTGLLLAGWLAACGSGRMPGADAYDGPALDPAPYRPQIVAIEAVLYQDGPMAETGRSRLADGMVALGLQVTETPGQPGKAFGYELAKLALMARRTRIDFPVERTPLRHQWERIRGSLFADAAWYRRSPNDPIAPAAPDPPPLSALRSPSRDERFIVEQAIARLDLLVEQADRNLDLMDQPDSSAIRREWTTSWQGQLADVTRDLGRDPGPGVDVFFRQSHQELTQGIGLLNQIVAMTVANAHTLRVGRIGEAREHVAEAQRDLGRVN